MSGKLKNRTRRALTFNLTTKVAPVRHLFGRRTDHRDGTVSIADKRLVLPDSVTVLTGKHNLSTSLPDSAVSCPEVAAALARKDVEWIPDSKEAEPAAEIPPVLEAPPPVEASEAPAEEASTRVDTSSEPRARRRA